MVDLESGSQQSIIEFGWTPNLASFDTFGKGLAPPESLRYFASLWLTLAYAVRHAHSANCHGVAGQTKTVNHCKVH
jgi:hypothetical protein